MQLGLRITNLKERRVLRRDKRIFKTVLSALFIAAAYVLPFLTGQIPDIGNMLCPMHLPVILCGFICGWQYGLAVGIISPILRSLITTMPSLFPRAVCMAAELAVYGMMAGLMDKIFPKKKIYIYLSLIIAMIAGRMVWGLSMFACLEMLGESRGFSYFIAESVFNAIPGIIIQLVFIPLAVMLTDKRK